MKSELKIETRVRSLKNYIDEFENGVFQIPSFQRDFLWSVDDIKQLFDSIKNSYPIGSIQFWQPLQSALEWSGNTPIGPYSMIKQKIHANNANAIFILDGYQRLSSIFGCLVNPEKYNRDKLTFDKNLWKEKFNIFYDLETEEFISLRRGSKNNAIQVPIYLLLSASDFRKYAREKIEKIDDRGNIDMYLDRADQLAEVFNNYQIASVDIKNATIGEAVEIFWRVNAKGLEISKDWIVNALTNKNGFRLQSKIDVLVEDLIQYNFEGIKRDLLFNCIQSSFGKLYYDTDIEKLVKNESNDFNNIAKSTIISIDKAVRFLFDELHVVYHKLLPTNWHLIFLVEFFNIVKKPTEDDYLVLKKWFWFTAYSNYFTIYNPSKRSKAFSQFRSYFLEGNPIILYNDDPGVAFTSPKYKNTNLGSVRYCANLLFQLNYSVNSQKIDYKNYIGYNSFKLFSISSKKIDDKFLEMANSVFVLDSFFPTYDFQNKKHRNLSFLLSMENEGKFSELFITNEMREKFNGDNFKEILSMRHKLINDKEKLFVENLELIFEE
ncbi:DUF262 domain-containing protein [Tenacibaculum ovolyticum]|uniref:DUF262 domain-containing protein n=1 Tax=Tenacibaculum ovolyticum TaxID=104270 RepID=UPI001F1B9FCA|nr:DUF262 domain-containing protein [Tenacibaculum ovolyticum]